MMATQGFGIGSIVTQGYPFTIFDITTDISQILSFGVHITQEFRARVKI